LILDRIESRGELYKYQSDSTQVDLG